MTRVNIIFTGAPCTFLCIKILSLGTYSNHSFADFTEITKLGDFCKIHGGAGWGGAGWGNLIKNKMLQHSSWLLQPSQGRRGGGLGEGGCQHEGELARWLEHPRN